MRELKRDEYWCLFPNKHHKSKSKNDTPVLIKDPGPYFESNARVGGQRIAVVRLVEVDLEESKT